MQSLGVDTRISLVMLPTSLLRLRQQRCDCSVARGSARCQGLGLQLRLRRLCVCVLCCRVSLHHVILLLLRPRRLPLHFALVPDLVTLAWSQCRPVAPLRLHRTLALTRHCEQAPVPARKMVLFSEPLAAAAGRSVPRARSGLLCNAMLPSST
jgi:hypothetical protein